MDKVELLWKLQELEQELEKTINLQRKFSLVVSSKKLAGELEQLDKDLMLDQEKLLLTKKKLKAAELDWQSSAAEKKETENRLYSGNITQTKELEIWQDKLEQLKLLVGQKEEAVVELLEAIEEKEKLIQDKETLLLEKQQERQEQEEKNKVLGEKIKKKLVFLQKRCQEINSLLEPNWQKRYVDLQKKFSLGGIAKLKGDVCQGCYMSLSTGIIQKVSSQEGIHTCENCGRILYLAEDNLNKKC